MDQGVAPFEARDHRFNRIQRARPGLEVVRRRLLQSPSRRVPEEDDVGARPGKGRDDGDAYEATSAGDSDTAPSKVGTGVVQLITSDSSKRPVLAPF